ncbi:YgaP family membrane protein [Bradyrhizobium sp. 5.13L]
MNVDKAVLAFAGCVVLLGLALGAYVNAYWYLLTAFAGLNMLQASFTGFCPAAIVFRKLGLSSGCAFS